MTQVFISYSRKDKAAVQALHAALQGRELDTWVDWEDIPPTALWRAEIHAAIAAADAFLFVLSPDSLASAVCAEELAAAVRLDKRLIPVVVRDVDPAATPPELARLNWIFLRASDPFDAGLAQIRAALAVDLAYVREHTRLLLRALDWESGGRDPSLLPRGAELRAAERWLAGAPDAPAPTALHRQYIAAGRQAAALPQGTVTFLYTDIEGSTRRWEQAPAAMRAAVARHDAILRAAIEQHGGVVFRTAGDAFCAAFPAPAPAVQAALAAQRALAAEPWAPEVGPVRVRMAVHTGAAEVQGGDYVGPMLNRVARILAAAHGGQVLVSALTVGLARDALGPDAVVTDLGTHRLRDLAQPEHLYQVQPAGLPAAFPPLATLAGQPNNLPVATTPLVGRAAEAAVVAARLAAPGTRLLTLTGPGGIGKTRLALAVAAAVLPTCPDGVFFVNVAPLVDADLVLPTIARALGLRETAGQSLAETLAAYLRDKRLLLVLDNCEQVPAAAPAVAALLQDAPGLQVLATSRAPLHLSMEQEYPVPPLAVPDAEAATPAALVGNDAVTLFVERAQAVKPDFALTDANAPAVAAICARLEGIPLALELAAARSKVLAPAAILARLGSGLALLTGGARDLPARQQTLRATIDWSYDLLTPEEQQLFRRMAVFRGGRTLEAAEAVCNADGDLALDVLDGIASLLDKSLLLPGEGRTGEPRYRMLETIREYAGERLAAAGEAAALRRRHARYFAALAEAAEPQLKGPEQATWLDRLEDEHDNIRAALAWAQAPDAPAPDAAGGPSPVEIGLCIAGAIRSFWYTRGYVREGRGHLAALLAAADAPGTAVTLATRARALNAAGALAWAQSDYAAARASYEATLAAYRALDDPVGLPVALNNLGIVAYKRGDFPTARGLFAEARDRYHALGERWGEGNALNNLGSMAHDQGDYAGARPLLEQSLAIFRDLGDKLGAGLALNNLGAVAVGEGDYARARALYEEGLSIRRELGDKRGVGLALNNLGNVALEQGDPATARALHEEALAVRRALGDQAGVGASLHNLGRVAHARGDAAAAYALHAEGLALRRTHGDQRGLAASLAGLAALPLAVPPPDPGADPAAERAVRVLAAADALLARLGATLDPADRLPYERTLAAARARLAPAAFARAWDAGGRLSVDEAVALALQRDAPAPAPACTA